ncbi:hypothetical protein OG394_01215 [Kribbella sp. NBC_01245]|uniref:hypothetical protein n=1 Tax=Kribbella sp. NBC_01245 TaxID=2903578 RepID=UPI002E2B045A|nr:hypothetical protein [Kribbella sp. NBC_01245]
MTAKIGPNGEIGKDTALQAFAAAFGPLPGVSLPTGDIGQVPSGTGALRWLIGHWAEITPAQRAAATALVPTLAGLPVQPNKSGNSAMTAVSRQAPAVVLATPKPGPKAAFYTAMAEAAAREIGSRVGVALTLTLDADERRTQSSTADADSAPLTAKGEYVGKAARCQISISPKTPPTGAYLEMVMAHEVWHCFEGQVLGLDRFYSPTRGAWLIEGQAEWVGYELHPDAPSDGFWDQYVQHPELKLFRHSYPAIGFYARLGHTGKDAWQVLIPMLRETSNEAAFQVSGAGSDAFLYNWASSYFRAKTLGDAWDMTGPGLAPGPGAKDPGLVVGKGGTTPFAAAAYTNAIFQLASEAEVTTFAVKGHVRLGDVPSRRDYLVNDGSSFCTKPGGCTCPAGSNYQGPPLTQVDTTTLFAVTGGPSGTKGTATGRSIEEFCGKPPVKARTLKVSVCPPTGWMTELMGRSYQFDGNGISRTFKVPVGEIWCVYVPVAEVPGSVRLWFKTLPAGKTLPMSPKGQAIQIPGLEHSWQESYPNSGFGTALIYGQSGRVVLGAEVMVKGRPRPDLTRRLVDRILAKYLV